jgi:TolB protein
MPETRFEDEVRRALRDEAATQPFRVSSVAPAASKARRRLLRNGIVAGVLGLGAVVASLSGIRLAYMDSSVPGTTPTLPLPHGDGKIAFVGASDQDIFTVEPDGSGIVRLTTCEVTPCGSVGGLAWSPDGATLLFSRFKDKFDPVGGAMGPLYAIDADGSNLRPLTDCQSPSCQDFSAVWSPEGTRIAFVRDGSGSGVYVMDADGSNLTLVSAGDTGSGRPTWSPDGRRIAFDRYADPDGTSTIFIAAADGSGMTPLVSGEGLPSRPAWSPDGALVAYTSNDAYSSKHGVDGQPRARIWVTRVDGADQRLLYSGEPGTTDLGPLAWSPSGTKLAFSIAPNARTRTTFVIDADGSHLRKLPGGGFRLEWAPSGRSIADVVGGSLTVVSSDGTGSRVVADGLGLFGIAWQPV